MGKIIDKIKSWFKRKPRLEERYTVDRIFLGRSQELKRFIEERQHHCEMQGIKFSIIEKDFLDCRYGTVELLKNGKVVESALLKRNTNGLVYWTFDNQK